MYRKFLSVAVTALLLTGCYSGPGYYESQVYTQPATIVGGAYTYDTGYRPSYYAERRIYVAPRPRYHSSPRYYTAPRSYNTPRYYAPPPRYYAPPPLPRHYQPGRPPGHAWNAPGPRGFDGYRQRPGLRGDYRGGSSWRDRGGRDGSHWHRSGDYRRGDGRGGHR
jgi:hypothetical protein